MTMGTGMTTTMGTAMTTDGLLTLMQWLSPAYPVGSFGWSHGLEQAIADGQVTDADSLRDWLDLVLSHGAGRSDAILLGAAHAAPDGPALATIAALAEALAPSAQRRAEALEQGAAFAATTRAVWGYALPDMAYPVAVGRAAGLAGLARRDVTQAYLLAFVSNLVLAAQRLMPLGQTAAQQVIRALGPRCAAVAAEATAAALDDLGSAAFAIDIAAMRHETLASRIFRS